MWSFQMEMGCERNKIPKAKCVLRFISKEKALCAKDDNGKIVGVLLFSRRHNMICCLGVSPAYRKFGFVEDELIEEFGYPHQRFILHP